MSDPDNLEQRLRQTLDARRDRLDKESLRRLQLARHAALAPLDRAGSWQRRHRPWALPAGAVAGVLALAAGVSVWLQPVPDAAPDALITSSETLVEIAVGDVDIELLEEIDFYDWLTLMQADGDSA